jgi:hypothetical protein
MIFEVENSLSSMEFSDSSCGYINGCGGGRGAVIGYRNGVGYCYSHSSGYGDVNCDGFGTINGYGDGENYIEL